MKEKIKNIMGISIIFLAVIKYYSTFLGYTSLNKYGMILSLLLSTALIVYGRKKYNLIHFLFLIVFVVQFVISKNITVLYAYYLCLALYNLDFKLIIKWFLIFCCIMFSVFLFTNLVNINITEYIDGRNDFGFGNPNTAFISMFMIWSSFFYYIFYSDKKYDYILMFLMIFFMYSQTMTRTGLITAIATLIAYVILKGTDVKKKGMTIFVSIFPLFMTFISLVIALFLSNNYFINNVLSHRAVYWNTYILHPTKGVNLFGYVSNIREILFTQRMPLDSGYIWTLYSSGIIVFVMLILAMSYTLYVLCKEDKKDQILLMVSILIYCFAESIMIDISTNVALILIVYGISKIDLKNINFRKKQRV